MIEDDKQMLEDIEMNTKKKWAHFTVKLPKGFGSLSRKRKTIIEVEGKRVGADFEFESKGTDIMSGMNLLLRIPAQFFQIETLEEEENDE